jgi:hypothetical protein
VHTLELQNAGYVALRAFDGRSRSFKLMVTNWGSDIFWFQKYPKHKAKLERLLAIADYYSAECTRDVALAKNLGFRGQTMPVIPNAGGLDLASLQNLVAPADGRKLIAVKGYHGWVGRSMVALEALEQLADTIRDFHIHVYSAEPHVIQKAAALAARTGLSVSWSPIGAMSHLEMLTMFGNARIYIGLSESDGISTSLLEAMAMGAIPVQTATACCDEWFSTSGVAIHKIEASVVAEGIVRALELSKDPANAEVNRETIRRKANALEVSKIARTFYSL